MGLVLDRLMVEMAACAGQTDEGDCGLLAFRGD